MNIPTRRDDEFGAILKALTSFFQYEVEEVKFSFDAQIGSTEKDSLEHLALIFHEAQSSLETNAHAHLNPFAQSMFDMWIKVIDPVKIEEANRFIAEHEKPNKLSFCVVIGRDRKNFGPYYYFNVDIVATKRLDEANRQLVYPVTCIQIVLSRQAMVVEADA